MIEGKVKALSKSKCRTITTNFSSNLSKSKPLNTDIKDTESHYFVPTSNRSSKIPNLYLPSNKSLVVPSDLSDFITPTNNLKPEIGQSNSNLQLNNKLNVKKIVKMFNIFKIPFNTPNKSQNESNKELLSNTSNNILYKNTSPIQKDIHPSVAYSTILNESNIYIPHTHTENQLLPNQSRNGTAKLSSNTALPAVASGKEKMLFSPIKKKSLSTNKLKNCSLKNRNNSLILNQNNQKHITSKLLLKCSPIPINSSRKNSIKNNTTVKNSLDFNYLIKELTKKQPITKKINCNSLNILRNEKTDTNKIREEGINSKKQALISDRKCKSHQKKNNNSFFIADNLKFIKIIGVGAFSSVRLYEEIRKNADTVNIKIGEDSSNLLAIKVYDKKALGDKYKANSINNEVSIVRSLNSDLIIRLFKYQETVNQVSLS